MPDGNTQYCISKKFLQYAVLDASNLPANRSVLIQCTPIRPWSFFIAHKYRSLTVNVFSSGSPSLMRKVLRISFGITIRPRSSTLRTIPVAFIYLLSSFMSNYDAIICKARRFIRGETESSRDDTGAFCCDMNNRKRITFLQASSSPEFLT